MHERMQDIEHAALEKIAMLETELIQLRLVVVICKMLFCK